MGRTIPSYRLASERERRKWKIFRQELDKSERKMFDEMFSYSSLYNSAGSNACRPILIHPIGLNIFLPFSNKISHKMLSLKVYVIGTQ